VWSFLFSYLLLFLVSLQFQSRYILSSDYNICPNEATVL